MKKNITVLLMILVFICLDAKGLRHSSLPLLEIGPKASLYISDDFALGIGCEVVCNPARNIGIRVDAAELRFGGTTVFYLNHYTSIDGLFYIPMRGIEPYVHGGVGFAFIDNEAPADNTTMFNMRFGMGFLFPMSPRTNVFIEPGILIDNVGDHTDAIFRLSFGARFGII